MSVLINAVYILIAHVANSSRRRVMGGRRKGDSRLSGLAATGLASRFTSSHFGEFSRGKIEGGLIDGCGYVELVVLVVVGSSTFDM